MESVQNPPSILLPDKHEINLLELNTAHRDEKEIYPTQKKSLSIYPSIPPAPSGFLPDIHLQLLRDDTQRIGSSTSTECSSRISILDWPHQPNTANGCLRVYMAGLDAEREGGRGVRSWKKKQDMFSSFFRGCRIPEQNFFLGRVSRLRYIEGRARWMIGISPIAGGLG